MDWNLKETIVIFKFSTDKFIKKEFLNNLVNFSKRSAFSKGPKRLFLNFQIRVCVRFVKYAGSTITSISPDFSNQWNNALKDAERNLLKHMLKEINEILNDASKKFDKTIKSLYKINFSKEKEPF